MTGGGRRRGRGCLGGAGIAAGCVVLSLVMVRVGLDWSDSRPYAPWVETYYIVLACAAVLLALAGLVGGFWWWRARRR